MIEKTFDFGKIKFDPQKCIVYTEYNEDLIIDLATAKRIRQEIYKITEDKKFGILSDMTKAIVVDTDARHFLAKDEQKRIVAAASLIKDDFHKHLANVFVNFTKIDYKYRFFTSKEKAEKWLLEQLKDFC